MNDRQEAAATTDTPEQALVFLDTVMHSDNADMRRGAYNRVAIHIKEAARKPLTPPLQSEVQEAVRFNQDARVILGLALDALAEGESVDFDEVHEFWMSLVDSCAVMTAALSSASETEAAFIELMEADDPEPYMHPTAGYESPEHGRWRQRQALKAAHKPLYDSRKGDA